MIVENTSDKIVKRMLKHDIIDDKESAIYSYHIQVILEAAVGHAILLSLASLTGHFIEILLFLLSFDILRGSTSGYHCKTNVGCLILSTIACSTVVLLENLALSHILYCQGGVIMSMIFIILVGAVNHPNMGWSDEELKAAKKSSRVKILVLFLFLSVLDCLGIEKRYLYCFGMGIIQCSISLVLVHFSRKGASCKIKTDSSAKGEW